MLWVSVFLFLTGSCMLAVHLVSSIFGLGQLMSPTESYLGSIDIQTAAIAAYAGSLAAAMISIADRVTSLVDKIWPLVEKIAASEREKEDMPTKAT